MLLPNPGQATLQEIYSYQQKIRSILFAACQTRPDIAFTATKLSEFIQNPSSEHQAAVNRAISYLNRTKEYTLELGPPLDETSDMFFSASDAAFANDPTTRRSTKGYIFKMFGGAID